MFISVFLPVTLFIHSPSLECGHAVVRECHGEKSNTVDGPAKSGYHQLKAAVNFSHL